MQLSPADQVKARAWFNTHATKCVCPGCGGNDFGLGNDVYLAPLFGEGGALEVGGKAIPMIPLACNRCSAIIWFGVGKMGVLTS